MPHKAKQRSRITREDSAKKIRDLKKGQRVLVHDPSKKGPKLPRKPTAEEIRQFNSSRFGIGTAKAAPPRPTSKTSRGPAKDIDEEMRRLGKK